MFCLDPFSVVFIYHRFLLCSCCCSFTEPCSTACDPMDCSTAGFPVLHHLLKLAQSHVHWVSEAIHPSISSSVVPFSSCLRSFPASGSFQMNQFFTSGGQSIGASASVLLMNIQHWFPLGLTDLISLKFKGLSRFVVTVRLYKASYIHDVSWWSLNFKYFFNSLTFILFLLKLLFFDTIFYI